MIEVLQIIAGSWPIAIMISVAIIGSIVNRRVKQRQEDQAAIYNLRSSNSTVVRMRDEVG